jgi:hypothetical protein
MPQHIYRETELKNKGFSDTILSKMKGNKYNANKTSVKQELKRIMITKSDNDKRTIRYHAIKMLFDENSETSITTMEFTREELGYKDTEFSKSKIKVYRPSKIIELNSLAEDTDFLAILDDNEEITIKFDSNETVKFKREDYNDPDGITVHQRYKIKEFTPSLNGKFNKSVSAFFNKDSPKDSVSYLEVGDKITIKNKKFRIGSIHGDGEESESEPNTGGTVESTLLITGPSGSAGALTSTKSIPENTTAVHTFYANETVTWSLNGGVDSSKFTLSSTGVLSFTSAPNYENSSDSNGSNNYEVIIRASDTPGNSNLDNVMDIKKIDFENYELGKISNSQATQPTIQHGWSGGSQTYFANDGTDWNYERITDKASQSGSKSWFLSGRVYGNPNTGSPYTPSLLPKGSTEQDLFGKVFELEFWFKADDGQVEPERLPASGTTKNALHKIYGGTFAGNDRAGFNVNIQDSPTGVRVYSYSYNNGSYPIIDIATNLDRDKWHRVNVRATYDALGDVTKHKQEYSVTTEGQSDAAFIEIPEWSNLWRAASGYDPSYGDSVTWGNSS